MAINSPTDTELWRAEADKLYLSWLIDQQLSPVQHEEKRATAYDNRLKRTADSDRQMQVLLRATDSVECIAHADRYPGADA